LQQYYILPLLKVVDTIDMYGRQNLFMVV